MASYVYHVLLLIVCVGLCMGAIQRQATVCEGQQQMISCPANQAVNIAYASYGRNSKAYCKSGVKLMKNVKCHAKSSVLKVQQRCNRQRTCVLQSNNRVFGDPCVGTYKYLFVRYSCVPVLLAEATLCEGQKKLISCAAGKSINIMFASYGRKSTAICRKGNNLMKNLKCHSNKSLLKVQQACNKRNKCVLQANNVVFGDPCYGTYKYLYVRYRCIKDNVEMKAVYTFDPFSTSKGKFLRTISTLGMEYNVTFSFYPTIFTPGWKNVFHMTSGNQDNKKYGDRIPGVWFSHMKPIGNNGDKHRIYVCSAVSGNKDYCYHSSPYLRVKQWHNFEISQRNMIDNVYIYTVRVNGRVVRAMENSRPQRFTNVKVYASDGWYVSQPGLMRNLRIETNMQSVQPK